MQKVCTHLDGSSPSDCKQNDRLQESGVSIQKVQQGSPCELALPNVVNFVRDGDDLVEDEDH